MSKSTDGETATRGVIVHGRFQVFHLDHLRYLHYAFRCDDHVLIGLTGIPSLSTTAQSGSPHRRNPADNPLSYYERVEMISMALTADGVGRDRFSFTPFPIEQPDLLAYFVGSKRRMLTTVREPWNEAKIQILRNYGHEVLVAYTDYEKPISGARIRRLISLGDPTWKHLVPTGTLTYLESIDIASRMHGCTA